MGFTAMLAFSLGTAAVLLVVSFAWELRHDIVRPFKDNPKKTHRKP